MQLTFSGSPDPAFVELLEGIVRRQLEKMQRPAVPIQPLPGRGRMDLAIEVTGLSAQHIYALKRKKEIPFLKVGKTLMFERKELEKWLDEKRKPASQTKKTR